MLTQLLHLMTDEHPAIVRAHRHQLNPTVGKIQHLQRPGEFNQALDVGGDLLLGADEDIDRQRILGKQLVSTLILNLSDTRDLGGRAEQRVGDLAGHHVDFVAVGDCDDHVRIMGPGAFEHAGVGGMAADRA